MRSVNYCAMFLLTLYTLFFFNWGFICLFLDLRANLLRIIPSLTRLSGFSQA